jgi:hypothetical protein
LRRRVLAATTSVAALLGPAAAAHADSPVVLTGVVLSTGNATVSPATCSTTTRVGVYYADPDRHGPPAGSGIVVTNAAAGLTPGIASSDVRWRNGVSSVTYGVRLCGIDAGYPTTEPGWYTVAVRLGPGTQTPPRAGFTVRYRAVMDFDAAPEPVRRGGAVTLTASVSDGWEYFDTHPVRLYFRRTGTTAWRYFGAATPRCVEWCDGEAVYSATRRFRQTVSGTWKAVSTRTSYVDSGSRTDAVAVTPGRA